MEEKDFIEETPDIYTLSDDEGNEYTFEALDEADFENGHYVAMLPVYDDPEESLQDSDPLVIMKQTVTISSLKKFPTKRNSAEWPIFSRLVSRTFSI